MSYKLHMMARGAGKVARYHTAPLLRSENVAEHSFGVALWAMRLTGAACSAALLQACLTHDLGETAVGDIPSPIKRRLPVEVLALMERKECDAVALLFPTLPQITPEEGYILSLADKLDGLCKCIEEVRDGNRGAAQIGERYAGYLMTLTDDEDNPHRLIVAETIQALRTEYLV